MISSYLQENPPLTPTATATATATTKSRWYRLPIVGIACLFVIKLDVRNLNQFQDRASGARHLSSSSSSGEVILHNNDNGNPHYHQLQNKMRATMGTTPIIPLMVAYDSSLDKDLSPLRPIPKASKWTKKPMTVFWFPGQREQDQEGQGKRKRQRGISRDPTNKKHKHHHHHRHHQQVEELGQGGLQEQQRIQENSNDDDPPDELLLLPEGCQAQYDWQLQSFPNCNLIHEQDMLTKSTTVQPQHQRRIQNQPTSRKPRRPNKKQSQFYHVASGGYRMVWFLQHADLPPSRTSAANKSTRQQQHHHQPPTPPPTSARMVEIFAFKTFYLNNPVKGGWTQKNFDRHRRDALVSGRLTSSPNALHQYAYCGNTGIYDFANGGSLEDLVNKKERKNRNNSPPNWRTNATRLLSLAHQVAKAMADVHNIDQEGRASFVHADLSLSQFVSMDGGATYKINDFNRARFLYQSTSNSTENCPFEVKSNAGSFRSPEEYAYQPETEKIDVYSMGNVLYVLLTGNQPFEAEEDLDPYLSLHKNRKRIPSKVKKGKRPTIPKEHLHSTNPQIQAIVKAIQLCWIHNPTERASARSVERLLGGALNNNNSTVSTAIVLPRHPDNQQKESRKHKTFLPSQKVRQSPT